jgi:flagellar biosynthesis activator protein FlaF
VLQDNALPTDLKARLISLALWVQRYTPAVMGGTASPDPLIAVNKNILEGLAAVPEGAEVRPTTIPQLGAV